jgi:hypothetical protein
MKGHPQTDDIRMCTHFYTIGPVVKCSPAQRQHLGLPLEGASQRLLFMLAKGGLTFNREYLAHRAASSTLNSGVQVQKPNAETFSQTPTSRGLPHAHKSAYRDGSDHLYSVETMLRVTIRGVMKINNSFRFWFLVEFWNKNPRSGIFARPGTRDLD